MDIAVGDTILTRKKHPCGAQSFEVLRVGMDFKIRLRSLSFDAPGQDVKDHQKGDKARAGLDLPVHA